MKKENRLDGVPILVDVDHDRLNYHLDQLFVFYDGIAILNLIIDIPTKEEILPYTIDKECLDDVFESINANCKTALQRLVGTAIEETKCFGKYPHRTVPIELDILGHTERAENGHIVSKITFIIPDKSGVPFNDNIIKDVKVIYGGVISKITDALGVEISDIPSLVELSGDIKDNKTHGLAYLQSDRPKSQEEMKWVDLANNTSQFVSDVYHLRNMILFRNKGVATFMLDVKPLSLDLILKHSNYSEEEKPIFDELFREDPKVLTEMMISLLNEVIKVEGVMEKRGNEPFELKYCITRNIDKETGELASVGVGFAIAADGINDINNCNIENNPNFRTVFSALYQSYIRFYGLEDVPLDEVKEVIGDNLSLVNEGKYMVYYHSLPSEDVVIH